MIVIGVVGGIASGKSFVTGHLQSLGAVVLDADRIGHEVLRLEPVKAAIRRTWGDEVFSRDGNVDRQRLAAIVFDPDRPEQLHKLEEITHPTIAEQLRSEIRRFQQSGEVDYLVLDAAVMVKAGWHRFCDAILFVDASRERRLERAVARGWSPGMFANREAMQASVDEKRRISTHVVDNNGSREATIRQLDELWDRIRNLPLSRAR
jgi:dephospho-CoA kinase